MNAENIAGYEISFDNTEYLVAYTMPGVKGRPKKPHIDREGSIVKRNFTLYLANTWQYS